MLHQVAFLRDIKVSDAMAAAAYSTFVGISAVGRLGLGFLGLKYPYTTLSRYCHAFDDIRADALPVGRHSPDGFHL